MTLGLIVPGCTLLFPSKDGGFDRDSAEDDTGGFETGSAELGSGGDELGFTPDDAIDPQDPGDDSSTAESGEGGEIGEINEPVEPDEPDLGDGESPVPNGPRRSLIETNPEALVGLGMAPILSHAALAVDLLDDPEFTHTRLTDSFNSAEQAVLAGGSHCDDTLVDGIPSLGGYPIQCPRAEAGQVGGLQAWFPIAAVNRFDLAAEDGSDCGEQRLIVASNLQVRMLVIFEARIPNPEPSCGLLACRPVVDFWLGLEDIEDPAARAEQLRMAFLEGHPVLTEAGFEPFMAAVNLTFGAGQIRSNSFDDDPWTLRQFRFASEGERLGVVAEPVTASIFGPLWNDLGGQPQGPACRQSVLDELETLLVDDPAAMGLLVDPICFAGESRDDGQGGYAAALLAGSGGFEAALGQRLSELGSDLSPVELANRASFAVDCMGCHETATGLALGHDSISPSSRGFVHVSELELEPCDGGSCFAISPALEHSFLPARQAVLEAFVADSSSEPGCEGGPPDAITLLHEGPATTGLPSAVLGVEQLLNWERSLRAGLSKRTLSGRPRGAH
ncbi:MAG: hypothetical protein R6X02_07775 [Enhygromyxa sp.]